jgi:hypothetical protein
MSTKKRKGTAVATVAKAAKVEVPEAPVLQNVCSPSFTEEEAITTLNTFFTPSVSGIPKMATYIKADNGNYNTYVCNDRDCAAGHFNQVGVSNVNGKLAVKFLFEDPAPVTMFISKVPQDNNRIKKATKSVNENNNFTARCTSFATKHHFSGDEINTISKAYLQSLIDNVEFVRNNPDIAANIMQIIAFQGKYVMTIINGMVTINDIDQNVGPFGDPIKSVKMEGDKFVEAAASLGGTNKSTKKRRKTTKKTKKNNQKTKKIKKTILTTV